MSHVIVLAGGTSAERAVSLRSGAAVKAALRQTGHHVTMLDPADGLDEATVRQADAVFPALHGVGGEDGTVQGRLEAWRVRYVGSDAAASRRCFDKQGLKPLLRTAGITMPLGELVDRAGFAASSLRRQPFVLKPVDGGSSVDTFIIRDPAAFQDEPPFGTYGTMLLEKLIDGTELTVGVLDGTALPVTEIVPPPGGEFDFANKYNGRAREWCPPRTIPADRQAAAQALAVRAHHAAGCRDLSRSDFIVTADGELYLLEINTLPGMTGQSLFPKMAQAAGIGMPDLCDRLLRAALSR